MPIFPRKFADERDYMVTKLETMSNRCFSHCIEFPDRRLESLDNREMIWTGRKIDVLSVLSNGSAFSR